MSSAPTNTTTTPKKGPYPFYLGGVAATIAASITHPLDLTKVRLQASGDKRMIASLQKTYRAGGVLGLFDGITGTWLRQMSYSVCRFWAYDESKKLLGATKDSGPGTLVAAGAMAGGIAGAIGNPGEIVMVRLQADAAKPPAQRYNYKNALDAVWKMLTTEGPSSLARGLGPNVFRAVLMNASQIPAYDFTKSRLLLAGFGDTTGTHVMASGVAGTVATTVCSPADVLKSRIMNASGPGSNSTLTAIRTALKNEGPLFVFKGWLPAWTRLQPTTVLIFVVFERLKGVWDGVYSG
ncbi:dicarboxylic acid transporter [Schizophyllum amplum]|uniref:Dicarboxylic acid transporter n=1 Tax=Schizophyllum amplum TaxID=97359 RepID=A0A550CR85_9AGAR|nr:dicarboxylic acid transporter [Auriculariopsis ampla]